MKNAFKAAVVGLALGTAVPALAVTTVDVSGTANASLDGSNAVVVPLLAGKYRLNFTQALFTAFNRFSNTSGCDVNGANCALGFENSVRYVIGGVTFGFGDGNANGGIGPISPGNGYYDTAATSFANSGGFSADFTLAAPGNVDFYIVDNNLADNFGGVSLAISAIPEPATWALMILGFGLVGSALRRKRQLPGLAIA